MKVNSGDIHTQVAPGVDEMVFKVDDEDQGFIFEMLRSKIYSDPIAAICREIAANSRDANREVLKGHVPITIGFREEHPLNGDSSLHVFFKDDGPGISPDRMANVFCKYAKSTKRDTDEQTGGFGLGAKTPFAYTDAFTIITNVDGVKYTYTAYIDESRRGKIGKLDEQPTTDPNGTTIIVPIQPYDKRRFEREVIKYTSMWEVRPKYEGFTNATPDESLKMPFPADRTMTLKGGRPVLLVRDYNGRMFNNGIGMLVDGMPYEVDVAQASKYKDIHDSGSIDNYHMVILAKTGEVDLSVNRETLHYTTATIAFIEQALDEMREEMAKLVNDFVSGSTSYFEACVKAWSVMNDRTVHMRDGKELGGLSKMAMIWLRRYTPNDVMKMFDYNGKPVIIQPPKLSHLRFQVGYYSDSGNVAYRDVDFSFSFFYTREVYALDTKTKSVERTSYALSKISSSQKEIILVSDKVFKPFKGMAQDAADNASAEFAVKLSEQKKEFGHMEIPTTPYSVLPLSSKNRGKATKDEVITLNVREFKYTRYGSRKDWLTPRKVNVRRGSGPVDKDNNDVQHEVLYLVTADIVKCDEATSELMRDAAFMMSYYKMKLYIVPKRLAHHFKDCLDLETARSSFDKTVIQKAVNANAMIDMSKRVVNFGIANLHVGDQKLVDAINTLHNRARRYARSRFMKEIREMELLEYVAMHFGVKNTADMKTIEDYMERFGETYPLLSGYSDFRHVSNRAAINQYIKLMDVENARIAREKKRAEKAAAAENKQATTV